MREGLGKCLFWRTWKVRLLCAIQGILQHLRRFGVLGRINIVEVSMYAGRLGSVFFWRTWKVRLLCAIRGILQHSRRFGVPGA